MINKINNSSNDWQDLLRLVKNESFTIEKVRLIQKSITIEGSFSLPPLARLSLEDQIFVASFVKNHGSIKEMERLFGTSYPTIKNRLNRISDQLGFLNVDIQPDSSRAEVLDQLERGEISADVAVEILKS